MFTSPLVRVWARLLVVAACVLWIVQATELQVTRSGDDVILSWPSNAGADSYVQVPIITTNQYADFDLVWDWKAGTAGNGGVLYRVTEYYDQPYKSAPEYQLIDDSAYSLPGKQQLARCLV